MNYSLKKNRWDMKTINSMTGYGKGSSSREGRKITIEIKSVNHRFLDLSIKMPRQLQFAEDEIKKIISSEISRGHVDVFVNYEDNRLLKSKLVINQELADRYVEEAQKLSAKGLINNFGVSEILSNKDIVSLEVIEDDENTMISLVTEATKVALLQILEMKSTEGKKLTEDLLSKIEGISLAISIISDRSPYTIKEYSERMKMRINEVLDGFEIDSNRLAQEIAIYTDRSNIDEELTRLRGHVEHYKKIINAGGFVGKSLDFLTQEANREANTIASKSNDSIITEQALILKNIIEMMREQIQNLE